MTMTTNDDDNDDKAKRHRNSDVVQMMFWPLPLMTPPLAPFLRPSTGCVIYEKPIKIQ